MKANYKRIATEFAPETRFEVPALPASPYRAGQQNRLEQLKLRLLAEQLEQLWEPEINSQVRRAANEAAALAWVTPFPMLMFPVLFEEKVAVALGIAERQAQV